MAPPYADTLFQIPCGIGLSQIVDQRVKNGIKQIKIKKKNKDAKWKNLEEYFLQK